MIQRQLIEKFKSHAPELQENEIRDRLNAASDLFCEETGILWDQWSFMTNPNQMYYELDDRCIDVSEVNYNNEIAEPIVNVHNVLIGR